METAPQNNNVGKPVESIRKFSPQEEAIKKFFLEKGEDKLNFDTPQEAILKSEEVNKVYGDISFVAEDKGRFSVKFRSLHLGAGFEEYKPENGENGGESDLEKAA